MQSTRRTGEDEAGTSCSCCTPRTSFGSIWARSAKGQGIAENTLTAAAAAAMASAHLVTAPQLVTSVSGSHVCTKINKPPVLPHFSGVDPIPKDEGSYEQWRFQVVGAQMVCTEEAVCSAIVCSVQGEVREMISFLGFDANLDDILEKVEKWFGKAVIW